MTIEAPEDIPGDLQEEDIAEDLGLTQVDHPTTGTVDDEDDPSDEREDENEPPVRERSDATEAPEEFEVDDEDDL
jgi:hypothetical protein